MTACQGCANCACKANKVVEDSLWVKTASAEPDYPALQADTTVDVCIVGAGMTGLTAAWQLAKAGKKVAVIDKASVAQGVTGYTSAHLTSFLDIRYTALRRQMGLKAAKQMAQDSQQAIAFVKETAAAIGLADSFQSVPGYLFALKSEDVVLLQAEASLMAELGLPATFVTDVPFPEAAHGAVKIEDQGQFQPVTYLQHLAKAVIKAGGTIYTHTTANDIQGTTVVTDGGRIVAQDVILATHTPPFTRFLPVQAKLRPWQSYIVVVKLGEGELPPAGLFYDTAKPYHYVRSFADATGSYVVVGGEDVASGTGADGQARLKKLAAYACQRWPKAELVYQWSSMYFDSVDMVPYIGQAPFTPHVYLATGYAGTGLTFGTVAGRQLAAVIAGEKVPTLYNPGRVSLASLWPLCKAGAANAKHVLIDRLRKAPKGAVENLQANEGKVMQLNGQRVAAYKDERGQVTLLSPVCTHAGCIVDWNNESKSWDCPCHGSRFTATGQVMAGPASKPLKRL